MFHTPSQHLLAHHLIKRFPEEVFNLETEVRLDRSIRREYFVLVTPFAFAITALVNRLAVFFGVLPFDKKCLNLDKLDKSGAEWRLTFSDGTTKVVQKVFLAIGFGDERTAGAADTYDYWKERGVGTAAVEANAPATYLVSGNGDGALTDVLNLLVKGFEHVAFTESFLGYFNHDDLRTTVLKAYKGLDPEANLEPLFKQDVLNIFRERGILDRLVPRLRTDRHLTINSSGHLLSVGKAAQLNQCMVFAVLYAAQQAGIVVRRSSGNISDVIKHSDGLEPVGLVLNGITLSEHFHHVILRHGPNKRERYRPAEMQFDEFKKVSEARFKASPELLVPPTLDPETYTLFFELWRQKLADVARRQQLAGQTAREVSTILITWDAATQTLVQRGKVALEDLIAQCETATAPIILQLEVLPDQVDADNLIRLSKASDGKISFSLGTSVQSAWKAKLPNAPTATSVSSRYPYREVSAISISDHVDASLVRQLESALVSTQTAGKCDTLGKIATDVLDAVLATWTGWRQTLDASSSLRRDFLAWLGNIGPVSAKSWSGDVGVLERMASALVLILATHLGEPLQPASVPRGNLSFDKNGQALGSAASKVTRDAKVAELRSSIQALQLRFPSLGADIERAERVAQDSEGLLNGQKDILVELRKSVTAMSSAVASVAANLPHDACDCPVCATHFEEKGELYRRAANAAERLAPLVLIQEERVQSAVQRSEAASNRLEQLRLAKRDLTSIVQECESEEQAKKVLAVGVFGTDGVDRPVAEARQWQLAGSAEAMARLRQRKWYWRNRLTGDFFMPGGEHASAVRRRDQAQVQLSASIQARVSLARELETTNASVSELDEVVGGLRDAELEGAIRGMQIDLVSAETASEQATSTRQAIEQQLASLDIAAASARTRQQQAADQIAAAARGKTQAAETWQRLNFAESNEPDALSLRGWTTAIQAIRERLREADDLLKQLRDGRSAKTLVDNHLTALERLRTAVSGAPNSDRLQLRREAEDSVAAKSRLAQATRETKHIAQAASADILDELAEFNTSYMQPLDALMKSINRAILCDPRVGIELHVKNRRVEQSATKEGEVPAEIGSIDPVLVHSEGQMAALSVSLLCAASLTYPWSRWRGLVLDDPLQHNDAIHSAAFADFVCNLVADRQYQVLLSTHDRAQAEFLRRKVASRNLPCAILSLLGTGQEGVEWSYRPADSVIPVAASA